MRARIAALASHVGEGRNQEGAAVETCKDEVEMAIHVAREAIAQSLRREAQIDMVVFATSGIRQVFPSGSAAIAYALGLTCPSCDITAGCTSMGMAVQIGERIARRSLVICADLLSRTIDPREPSHRPLLSFADGAAAVIVSHDPGPGPRILSYSSKTHGKWGQFYGSREGRLLRSLPADLKGELGATYLQSWSDIGRELFDQCPKGVERWVYANQGDSALFPQLATELNISEDHIVRTEHGHAGGADPWIGFQLHPPPSGSAAVLLASGIGFTFHGTLLEVV